MSIDYQGKIVISLSERQVKGEKLRGLIDFLFNISDGLSLNSEDEKQMLGEEVAEAKAALKKYFEENGRTWWDDEELRGEQVRDFMPSKELLKKWMEEHLVDYPVHKREVTCRTHCTTGGPKVVYYFKQEEAIKQKFQEMGNLFESICLEDEEAFRLDDPAFYKDGEVICSICSHEATGSFVLEEEQYTRFRSLRIPHDVVHPRKTVSFEEWLEECAYQERETLTIHGWQTERIPEQLGKIRTLKNLQIFDHQVTYLPKSLEELTELECLRITGNKVESLGFDISRLKKLKILDLGGMPLKSFPVGILELKGLEEIYMGDASITEIPDGLMALEQLRVLSLPKIEDGVSPALLKFIEKFKQKEVGVSLREVLGEEAWEKIVENSNDIIINN